MNNKVTNSLSDVAGTPERQCLSEPSRPMQLVEGDGTISPESLNGVLEQTTYMGGNMLHQVLNQKKMALMKSPEVVEFLKKKQGQLQGQGHAQEGDISDR